MSDFGPLLDKKTEDMIRSIEARSLSGGKKKQLTVLFSDIYSFTALLVRQPLEATVYDLNEYFTEMVIAVHTYGGLVDKFMGDAMKVEFGATTHFPDHAERACLASLEMVRACERLWEQWKRRGKIAYKIRIGINTGEMIVGNMVSEQQYDFTVIGESVNFCIRLRDINKAYCPGKHIIISEFTKNELSDMMVTRELDTIRAKGREIPVTIYELVGEKDEIIYPEEFIEHYDEGLINYKKREWNEAIREFNKALELNEDRVCELYIDRCKQYINNPPPADWDGTFIRMTN